MQRNLDADPDLDALDEEEMAVLRVLQSYSTPAPAASVSHVHQAPPQLYPSQALPEAKTTLAQPQAPALLAQPPQRLQRQLHWPGGEQGALPRQPPAEQPSLEGFCQEVLQQHMLQQALKFWRAAALRGQRARMLASARLEQWQQQRQQAQMAGMLSAWRALVAAWMKRDALLSQAMDLMHRR